MTLATVLSQPPLAPPTSTKALLDELSTTTTSVLTLVLTSNPQPLPPFTSHQPVSSPPRHLSPADRALPQTTHDAFSSAGIRHELRARASAPRLYVGKTNLK